eukprot:2714172-Pleurochrysis_carterae.AAC.1
MAMCNLIGVPLVWRYLWKADKKRVLIQFKFSLTDVGEFMKDEWGPWEDVIVDYLDTATDTINRVKISLIDEKG